MASPPQFAARPPPSTTRQAHHHKSAKPHITETPLTKANWYKHVNWVNTTFIVGVPLAGCIMAFWTPLQWKTAVWAVAYYFMTGMGITAGMRCHMTEQ